MAPATAEVPAGGSGGLVTMDEDGDDGDNVYLNTRKVSLRYSNVTVRVGKVNIVTILTIPTKGRLLTNRWAPMGTQTAGCGATTAQIAREKRARPQKRWLRGIRASRKPRARNTQGGCDLVNRHNERRASTGCAILVFKILRQLMYQNVQVAIPPSRTLAVATRDGIVVPRVIADAGDPAARRFLEFFAATIRNKNTRMAYYRAVCDFFSWCDRHRIGGIADIEPLHVAAYIENLQHAMSKPTVKQHLAAIRMLFDWLVTGQVVATNPAHSVRGPKHVVVAMRRAVSVLVFLEQHGIRLSTDANPRGECMRFRDFVYRLEIAATLGQREDLPCSVSPLGLYGGGAGRDERSAFRPQPEPWWYAILEDIEDERVCRGGNATPLIMIVMVVTVAVRLSTAVLMMIMSAAAEQQDAANIYREAKASDWNCLTEMDRHGGDEAADRLIADQDGDHGQDDRRREACEITELAGAKGEARIVSMPPRIAVGECRQKQCPGVR